MLEHHRRYYREARRIAARLRGRHQLSACLVFKAAVLINSACMARRDAFLGVGGFDIDIPICEDADLWARIAQSTGYVFVDQAVVRYRTGAPSMMHNLSENDEKLHVSYRHIQGKYRQMNGLLHALAMKFWARAILR
jgi:GT2 family glycosyltransferase